MTTLAGVQTLLKKYYGITIVKSTMVFWGSKFYHVTNIYHGKYLTVVKYTAPKYHGTFYYGNTMVFTLWQKYRPKIP